MCDHTNLIFAIDTDGYNTEHVVKKTYVSKTAGSEGTEYEILNLKPVPTPPVDTDDALGPIPGNVLQYRSVVCREGRPLSIGVPKGIDSADFTAKYPVGVGCAGYIDNLLISEIIEGTMINLFYDPDAESWEIATKGAVGGNYWFFRTQYPSVGVEGRQLTFRQMFLEACGVVDLETNGFGLNNIPFLSSLDRNMVYSFVLQHPLNHIVLLVDAPILYLVGVYRRGVEGGVVGVVGFEYRYHRGCIKNGRYFWTEGMRLLCVFLNIWVFWREDTKKPFNLFRPTTFDLRV